MKKQLYIYIGVILLYIAYNQFFQVEDERLNTIINILFASFLFLYIAYIAFLVMRRMRKASKK